MGLDDYKARWLRSAPGAKRRGYDSALGRFIQADSIVPGVGNPLAWDRFAYTLNNPVRYTDPSGQNPECGPDGIWCSDNFNEAYGISFLGKWTKRNTAIVQIAVETVAYKFALLLGLKNPAIAFSHVYKNGITFAWVSNYKDPQGEIYTSGAITISSSRIEFASLSKPMGYRTPQMAAAEARNNVIHELGHAFASLWYKNGKYEPGGPYGKSIPQGLMNNDGFYLYPEPPAARLTWR